MCWTCSSEKSLQDYKDKVPQNVADAINTEIGNVRAALESENAEDIRSKMSELTKAVMKIGESMNPGQDQQQQPPSDQQPGSEDGKEKTGGS